MVYTDSAGALQTADEKEKSYTPRPLATASTAAASVAAAANL
jgi:hypothetical protein